MEKSKRKGFTLVEVLGAVIVLGILVAFAVPMVSNYLKQGKDDYNEKLKSQLLLSGKEYYSSHTQKLPAKLGIIYRNNQDYSLVTLPEIQGENLVSKDFIDSEGRSCKESYVYVRQSENEKEYNYHACLICTGEDGKTVNYSNNDLACTGNFGDIKAPTCTTSYGSQPIYKNNTYFNPKNLYLKDVKDMYDDGTPGKVTGIIITKKNTNEEYQIKLKNESIESIDIINKINKLVKKDNKNDTYTIKVTDGLHYSNSCSEFVIDKERPTCNLVLEQSATSKKITLSPTDNYSKQENISKLISDKEENRIDDNNIGESFIEYSFKGKKDGTYYGYTKDEAGNSNECKEEVNIEMYDGDEPYCFISKDNDNNWYSSQGTNKKKELKLECYVYKAKNAQINYNEIKARNGLGNLKFTKTDNDNSSNKLTFNVVFNPVSDKFGEEYIDVKEGFIIDEKGKTNKAIESSKIKVDSKAPKIKYVPNKDYKKGGWYESPLNVEIKCEEKQQESGIAKFTINGKEYSNPTKTMTQEKAANPVKYTTSCIDKAGNKASKTEDYNVKISSADKSCGINKYRSCATSACGVKSYNTCRTSACGCQTRNRCKACGCNKYSYGWGDWNIKQAKGANSYPGNGSSNCSKSSHVGNIQRRFIRDLCFKWNSHTGVCRTPGDEWKWRKCKQQGCTEYKRCSSCSCATWYSCATSACGVKSYNTCRTSACGVESYKTCWHY